MTRNEVANLIGLFTWDFGNKFFIETDKGNFEWSDPNYGGNNIIREMDCSYLQWSGGSIGRDKGYHMISEYCPDFIYVGFDEKSWRM